MPSPFGIISKYMSTTITSNPNVYPYVPFLDLSLKEFKNTIQESEEISWDDVAKALDGVVVPAPNISGESTAAKVLSIFKDDEYRFGPLRFIEDNEEKWLAELDVFIRQDQPIQFTILGFPFKIPVPLKTNRILPDMGEVLALYRLQTIMSHIGKIYSPGAHVTLFTEGCFGPFVGVPTEHGVAYREFVEEIVHRLRFDAITIHDLVRLETSVDNFEELHRNKVNALKELYASGDQAYRAKYDGTFESVYRIVRPDDVDMTVLMDVYNEDLADSEVSDEVCAIRVSIRQRTHESIFDYHAYLMVRDDLDYLHKTVPESLTLSVSPKSNRLGVLPIDSVNIRLPYHGVPVYYQKDDQYLVEYLVDILRGDHSYTAVHIAGDTDVQPFYYKILG